MRKILLAFLTLSAMVVFLGCVEEDPTLEDDDPQNENNDEPIPDEPLTFDEIYATLNSEIPYFFNRDIILPFIDDVELMWRFQNRTIEHVLLYEAPFIDQTVTLYVEATYQNETKTYSFEMQQLAPDSARNRNVIYIEVDIPIDDVTKTEYRNAAVLVKGRSNDDHTVLFENNTVEIRGRGNSTWSMPKRPYRLKFSEDVSILGMPKARNYVLLAEYADKSLLRNTIVHKFAGMLEHIEHAVETRAVEVYFNGSYNGVYTLTEHIRIHENKLYVPSDLNNLDAGFFMELDQRFYDHGYQEWVDGINVSSKPYTFKHPNRDDLSRSQMEYIRNYIIDMENALRNHANYEDYIDVDNFIDYFIVQELFKNVDVGWGSVFFYKRPGEVLKMGPIWDFDLAIGNANYIDYGPENWYGMRHDKNLWFHLMMDIPEIRDRFRTRYFEIYYTIIPDLLEAVNRLGDAMVPMANRNFNRWDILGHYVWPNPQAMVDRNTYRGQLEYVYDYIEARAEWIYHAVQTPEFNNGIFH